MVNTCLNLPLYVELDMDFIPFICVTCLPVLQGSMAIPLKLPSGNEVMY